MLKHPLSPTAHPPAKRARLNSQRDVHGILRYTLSDELMIYIFSYLSARDLCTVQIISRNWARLATDNYLWRDLYLQEYGRRRLRGTTGFIGRTDGRSIKPLPGRARQDDDHILQWKWMFKTSTNWSKGRCVIECKNQIESPHGHIILAGPFVLTTTSKDDHFPRITLTSSFGMSHTIKCPSTNPSTICSIDTIALDQSPPERLSIQSEFRLAAFLSTGEYVVLSIPLSNPTASRRILTYVPTSRNTRTTPIIRAAYRHPLLVTLSQTFSLSIYDLSENTIKHTQTLTSFTSFPPSSLVLSAPNTIFNAYKLVLTYAIPVYPRHFSVGATELLISVSGAETSVPVEVVSTRTARTVDTPHGWIDDKKLRLMRDQWNRKVDGVAACETDGKWVVLASTPSNAQAESQQENTELQLYRLSLPAISNFLSSTSFASPPQPKLTFVRKLEGPLPSHSICSLTIADGRCVSLGHNGSIWVWDLEGGSGVEISDSRTDGRAFLTQGQVAFDDRRIICIANGALTVRRFDV